MGRISRQVMFMEMARAASRRSTCFRLNVGALVTHQNNPVSIGWNGADHGLPHCAGNHCPGVIPGACPTLHAESNALIKAEGLLDQSRLKFPVEVDMYVTHSPCLLCCERIQASRWLWVKRIFFEIPYRSTSHLGMFKPAEPPLATRDTQIYEVTPAGYVVDYFTRRVVELP